VFLTVEDSTDSEKPASAWASHGPGAVRSDHPTKGEATSGLSPSQPLTGRRIQASIRYKCKQFVTIQVPISRYEARYHPAGTAASGRRNEASAIQHRPDGRSFGRGSLVLDLRS